MSAPFNDRGPFAVGEICRIVAARNFPELIGREVTIKGPKKWHRNALDGSVYEAYDTDLFHLGFMVGPPEEALRRRPPSDSHERTYMEKWRDMAGKAPQRVGEPV
jgi:hypothetical protein